MSLSATISHENPINTVHKQLSTKFRKEARWISPYALPSSSLETKKTNIFNSLFPRFTSLRDQIVCCGQVGNPYCCLAVKVMFWIEVVWYLHVCLTLSRTCVVTFQRVPGGGVPSAGCKERSEDRRGPGGLHQQEGGQTDRYDCGVRGHTLWGTPPDREKTEGDWWVP